MGAILRAPGHYWNIESHPTGTVLKCGNVAGRRDHSRAWKNLFLECNYVAMQHSHAGEPVRVIHCRTTEENCELWGTFENMCADIF